MVHTQIYFTKDAFADIYDKPQNLYERPFVWGLDYCWGWLHFYNAIKGVNKNKFKCFYWSQENKKNGNRWNNVGRINTNNDLLCLIFQITLKKIFFFIMSLRFLAIWTLNIYIFFNNWRFRDFSISIKLVLIYFNLVIWKKEFSYEWNCNYSCWPQ